MQLNGDELGMIFKKETRKLVITAENRNQILETRIRAVVYIRRFVGRTSEW